MFNEKTCSVMALMTSCTIGANIYQSLEGAPVMNLNSRENFLHN